MSGGLSSIEADSCKTVSNGHFADHGCDVAQAYAAFSILTIIKMEGPLIGRWPTKGALL